MLDEEDITQATVWAFRKSLSVLVIVPMVLSVFTTYINLTRPDPKSTVNLVYVVISEAFVVITIAVNFLRTFYNAVDEDPDSELMSIFDDIIDLADGDIDAAEKGTVKTSAPTVKPGAGKTKFNPKRVPPKWVKTVFTLLGFWSKAKPKIPSKNNQVHPLTDAEVITPAT